jgi:hypothetical protein
MNFRYAVMERMRLGSRAFFGEVDPVRRQKCGASKKRADSMQVETALTLPAKLGEKISF